jgi:hypothetical protein
MRSFGNRESSAPGGRGNAKRQHAHPPREARPGLRAGAKPANVNSCCVHLILLYDFVFWRIGPNWDEGESPLTSHIFDTSDDIQQVLATAHNITIHKAPVRQLRISCLRECGTSPFIFDWLPLASRSQRHHAHETQRRMLKGRRRTGSPPSKTGRPPRQPSPETVLPPKREGRKLPRRVKGRSPEKCWARVISSGNWGLP